MAPTEETLLSAHKNFTGNGSPLAMTVDQMAEQVVKEMGHIDASRPRAEKRRIAKKLRGKRKYGYK